MRFFMALYLLVAASAWAANDGGTEDFDNGVRLFQLQRYAEALDSFLAARKAGLETPELGFNLGSTYYKLGRYEDSRNEFEKLLKVPSAAALAEYNLGLASLRLSDQTAAARHFAEAARIAQDQDLARLAKSALERLQAGVAAVTPQPRLHSLVSLARGHDSNVTLSADPDQLGVPHASDDYYEVFGATEYQVHGNRENGERLSATGYVRRNDDIDEFDQSVVQGAFSVDRRIGSWYTTSSLIVDTIFLDKDRFSSSATGSLEARHALPFNSSAGLRYQGSYINADGQFASLEGQRHALRGSLANQYGRAITQLGYEFEINDRSDLKAANGQFFSRSPIAHTVFLANATQVTSRLSLQPSVDYRFSRYRDPDRRAIVTPGADGGDPVISLRSGTRHDEGFHAAFRAEYAITPHVFAHGQYDYTDNRSNFDDFAYDRRAFSFGLGSQF